MSEAQVIEFRPRAQAPQEEADKRLWDVNRLKRAFRDAEEHATEPRQLAFRDRQYYYNYDNGQWTDYEKSQLNKRKQQIATSNRIKGKVNATLFYVDNVKTDPIVYGTKPGMEQATPIVENSLDYIERNTEFDNVEWECAFDLTWGGAETVEFGFDEHNDITITKIDFDRFFYDPRSQKKDFSDARYLGYCEWMDVEEAKHKYPDKEDLLKSALDGFSSYDQGYEDKPYGVYCDKYNERVRVVVIYYKAADGAWMLAHFTAAGVLFEGESPWPDEKGRPACGLISQALYRDGEGRIIGQIRDWISPQDEINQRKSRSLHLLSDRRTWGMTGWTNDENQTKEALARADGHLNVTMPKEQGWGLIDSTAEIQGNFELLQQAIGDIELGGQYVSGDKNRASDQSGVALERLQMAGLAQDAPFFKSHNNFKLRCYRMMWFMAKKFWTGPRALPVYGEDGPRFIAINEPGMGPMGQPVMTNPIAQIDVDIIIDAGPEMISLPAQEREQLKEIAQVLTVYPPPVAMILVEASSLKNKDKILAMLQQMMQPPPPDPEKEAKVQETLARAEKTKADTVKSAAETRKTDMEAAKIYAEGIAGPEPKERKQ